MENSEDEYCDLSTVLLDSEAKNKELTAENAALREQMVSKEISWEQEKKKLLDEKDSLVALLFMTKNDMVMALESARASQKQSDTQREEMNRKFKEKREEVHSLRKCLHFYIMKAAKVKESWKECDQLNEMKLSFDKTMTQLNAEWESWWIVKQEEVVAELETLQQHCEKKVSEVVREKDDVVNSVRKEMTALVEGNLESLAKVRAIETKIHQIETATKEKSFRKTQELQKQIRELEKKWLNKEEEWLGKAGKMEEEMQLLIQQTVELQELALKTNKEKAQMRKEEKKAKKETEKRLKKERKEEEEREKKEREENEKRLEREKEENEEREKKEKKERKEREKKDKKEAGKRGVTSFLPF